MQEIKEDLKRINETLQAFKLDTAKHLIRLETDCSYIKSAVAENKKRLKEIEQTTHRHENKIAAISVGITALVNGAWFLFSRAISGGH